VGPQPTHQSPLHLVKRYLRGRYLIAAISGVALAIPCAIGGYVLIPPLYESVGLVRVSPRMQKVMYETDENRLMPMFDSFVSAQAQYLQSRRILDHALEDPKLKVLGWPSGDDGIRLLSKRLEVKVPRGSEMIHVSVSHKRPEVAQAAVNAVLASYDSLKDEFNGLKMEARERTLDARVKELKPRLDSLRSQALALAQDIGTDDLEQLNSAKMDILVRRETELAELDLRIAHAQRGESAPGDQPQAQGDEVAFMALAAHDTTMWDLLSEREHLRVQQDSLRTKLSPDHRTMIDLKRRLESLDTRIRERAALDSASPGAGPNQAAGDASLAQLEAARATVDQLRKTAADDLKKIGAVRLRILSIREEAADVKRDLDETSARLNEMSVERVNLTKGRISLDQKGDFPVEPTTDRRVPLMIFGALLGLGLGGGLVWLFGFLRDGYRYVDQLDSLAAAPLLGIIPDLSEGGTDQDEHAALSVHHIRNTLQLQTDSVAEGRGRVIAVTSGMSGDGKTHLALALGLSFAVAGRRTLLIDADLVGRALSAQLGLRDAAGLSEAVKSGTLNGEVHASRPNLWVIPAGSAPTFKPEQLSSRLLERVLDQARDAYDTIIIDSGPILGSLEANLASSLSDRTILVVSRGQDPKVVRAALDRLRELGAACGGLVFNRAFATDFARSSSVLSASRRISAASSRPNQARSLGLARIIERDRQE
jgi:Mrp family chromosome partitioning ATPase/uncharacterized protein involved in exopolysaccharide biosynthesis